MQIIWRAAGLTGPMQLLKGQQHFKIHICPESFTQPYVSTRKALKEEESLSISRQFTLTLEKLFQFKAVGPFNMLQ